MKEIKQDDMLKISEGEGDSSKKALEKRKRQAGQSRDLKIQSHVEYLGKRILGN